MHDFFGISKRYITIQSLDPQDMVLVTNVVVHSDADSAVLPFHVSLGTVCPPSEADAVAYQDSVSSTAKHLSDIWFSHVAINECDSPFTSEHVLSMPSHASVMTSGLDSSLLSELLENTTIEHEHAFPPTGSMTLTPDSLEFKEVLFKALEFDTPSYAQVPSPILAEFK